MTREQFTRQLPELTNNPLPIKPPFVFNGMSSRIFPLRANLDTLQQVCDGYLNFIPPEAGRFRAAAPYVYLMVLDYGQVAESVTRIGWFAQVEVFFSVPVEWYKLVNGQWVFHDWAVITPYIFVNDSFSVPLGRTVYGFPKVLAEVTPSDSRWVNDPLAPITLARVSTKVFPEAYSGKGLESRVFLEVERAAPMSNFRVPIDPHSPIAPFVVASNVAQALGGFARDAMWMAQSMRIFPINALGSPALMGEMLKRMMPSFAPGGSGFVQNSLNLKQFRQSDCPDHICYQSLTNGRMETTAFNGGGLLGEDRTLLGDVSGGHVIRLYEHSSLPIARTLGLEIETSWKDEDVSVVEIKPVLPFWIDVNLKYDQGDNIAWRTHDGIWKDEAGKPFDPTQRPAANEAEAPTFNNAVVSAIEAIAGPFQFTGTTIRVLPLMARREAMQAFLDDYVNKALESPIPRPDGSGDEQVRFSVWSRKAEADEGAQPVGADIAYVYLTASSFDGVTSGTNNVGNWAKYELAFMIPVKWERLDSQGSWQTAGVGMVPAFSMVDDCIAAISRLEAQGIDARTANFVKPESVWMSSGDEDFCADPKQTLLRVDAEVWPAYGAGQKATMQPAIEISRRDPDAGLSEGASRDTSWEWAERLRLEQGSKKGVKAAHGAELKIARALALELLGNQTPFAVYSFKQFRDVTDPDKACYQSIVRVPRALREVFDVREIADTLVVRIHDYPSLEIVKTLGIMAPTVPGSESGIVHTAQAIRPFVIRATLDEPLAERILSRSGTNQWTLFDPAFQTLLSDHGPAITVDEKAETLQDQIDPSRMSAVMFQARQRRADTGEPAIGKKESRDAIARIDPQMVIESVLSREWGNFDDDALWRRGRRELVKAIAALPLSGDSKGFSESVLYRKINNLLAAAPGAVACEIPTFPTAGPLVSLSPSAGHGRKWGDRLEKILRSQRAFTDRRLKMESEVNVLATFAILGLDGIQEDFKLRGKPVPTVEELLQSVDGFMETLREIDALSVEGEPSAHNNLDTYILADKIRLGELLASLAGTLSEGKGKADLELAASRLEEFRQVVELARRYCDAQLQALLNKLSRAYQKPDYCIKRDSVGSDCDRLLPLTLSWDENWYYGHATQEPPATAVSPSALLLKSDGVSQGRPHF